MKISCRTKFDITATGVTGHYKPSRIPFIDGQGSTITDVNSWNLSRNKQRNWETITQIISLRTQLDNLTVPEKNNDWEFTFEIGNNNLFLDRDDPLWILKQDCQDVPMLTGLEEINSMGNILLVNTNIWFDIISVNI